MGSISRRKLSIRVFLLTVIVVLLNSCDSAVEEAKLIQEAVIESGDSIESTFSDFSPGSEYYWRIIATEDVTGREAKNETHKFTTK